MTPQEAKELTLKEWEHLAAHPEIEYKSACPLCELYRPDYCHECPLKNCNKGSAYYAWVISIAIETRRKAAQQIVDILKAWEPEE